MYFPQALVETGCADARQPANVLRSMQAAGHHTAADRGIPAGPAETGYSPGDIKPGAGPAQAHVLCRGAVGTAPGHQPGAADQIPTGEQPPLFDSQRERGATALARFAPVSPRVDSVCDQHRSEN